LVCSYANAKISKGEKRDTHLGNRLAGGAVGVFVSRHVDQKAQNIREDVAMHIGKLSQQRLELCDLQSCLLVCERLFIVCSVNETKQKNICIHVGQLS